MEISNNIPAPNQTRGITGKNPEYYLANDIYDMEVGTSVFFSDDEGYNRSYIITRFQHINYSRESSGEINKSEYRKFVSKKENNNGKVGFRIWRIK